jgi:hypothetical protein
MSSDLPSDRETLRPTADDSGWPAEVGRDELGARFRRRDYEGTLRLAEAMLARDPHDEAAQQFAQSCRLRLRRKLANDLGSLMRVPRRLSMKVDVRQLRIDHRRAFVLSLVDGGTSIQDILDLSPMADLETLQMLVGFFRQGIIAVG